MLLMFVLLRALGSEAVKISAFIKRKSRFCACRDRSENMNLRPGVGGGRGAEDKKYFKMYYF